MLHPDRVIGKQVTITADFGLNPSVSPVCGKTVYENQQLLRFLLKVYTIHQPQLLENPFCVIQHSQYWRKVFAVSVSRIIYVQISNICMNYLIYMCMHMYRYWKYVHKICTKNKYIYICRSVITPRKANTYVYAVCICW